MSPNLLQSHDHDVLDVDLDIVAGLQLLDHSTGHHSSRPGSLGGLRSSRRRGDRGWMHLHYSNHCFAKVSRSNK